MEGSEVVIGVHEEVVQPQSHRDRDLLGRIFGERHVELARAPEVARLEARPQRRTRLGREVRQFVSHLRVGLFAVPARQRGDALGHAVLADLSRVVLPAQLEPALVLLHPRLVEHALEVGDALSPRSRLRVALVQERRPRTAREEEGARGFEAEPRMGDRVDRPLEIPVLQDALGYEFVREQCRQRTESHALECRRVLGARQLLSKLGDRRKGLVAVDAEQEEIAPEAVPDRYAIEDGGVGAQHHLHRLVARRVLMVPLQVDAVRRQPTLRRLQELLGEEHVDAGHPRIARLGNDDVELSFGAEQRSIGVAADDLDLRVGRHREVPLVEEGRSLGDARRDLGHDHLFDGGQGTELSGRDACPEADHEATLGILAVQHRGQDRGEAHRQIVTLGVPVGLAVVDDRSRPHFSPARLLRFEHVDRSNRIVVVEDVLAVLRAVVDHPVGAVVGVCRGGAHAKEPRRQVRRSPIREEQQREHHRKRARGDDPGGHLEALHGGDSRRHDQRQQGDREYAVEIHPEEQRIAAEERAQQ